MNVLELPKLALSTQQPFAWLLAHNLKDVENRKWATPIRGDFCIHAGQKFDHEGYEWVRRTFPDIQMPRPSEFETGGIVGVAKLVACVSEHRSKWFVGPYGFVVAQAQPIKLLRMPGQLYFFPVLETIIEQYTRQMKGVRHVAAN